MPTRKPATTDQRTLTITIGKENQYIVESITKDNIDKSLA